MIKMIEINNVKIGSYGNYSSDNYGRNTQYAKFGHVTVYFSYETPVAVEAPNCGLVVSQNQWGKTTGKHLNWIDDGDKNSRVPHAEVLKLINQLAGGNKK